MRILSVALFLFFGFHSRLSEAVVYTPPPFTYGGFTSLRAFDTHPHTGFALADFNGDSFDDVVAWHDGSRRLVLYHSDRNGTLDVKQILDIPLGPEERVIFLYFEGQCADVNGDRRPDLVLFEVGTARFLFLETDEQGRFRAPKIWRNSSSSFYLAWQPVDLNLDGLADLAFSEDDNKMVVAIQRPGFQFDRDWWPTSATFPGFVGRNIGVGALDGQSLPDLVWTVRNERGDRRSLFFRNQGETSFLPGQALRLNTKNGPFVWGELAPDLNGDKLPDLLQRNETKGSISLFRGTGSEVFQAMDTLQAPVFGTARWFDFDGNGTLDLVEEDNDRSCYFLNDGKGNLQEPACESNETTGLRIRRILRGDLNGDERPDRILLGARGNEENFYLHHSLNGLMRLELTRPALPLEPVASQATNFRIHLKPPTPSFIPPSGYLSLLRDDQEMARLPIQGFVASANVVLEAGQYELSYRYSGDSNYAPSISEKSSLLLAPHATDTNLTLSPATLREDQELRFQVQVRSRNPKAAAPAGSISLRRDGQEIASLPLQNGMASWSAKGLLAGTSDYQAVYVPNVNFFPSESAPRKATITGLLKLSNALSLREAAAPSALVNVEARGPIAQATLQIGSLQIEASPTLVLPPNTPLGLQTVSLTRGNFRWEGRANITRQAPGILSTSAYWAQGQRIAELKPNEVFPLSTWLALPNSPVTLTLYGTGWRHATASSQIAVTLNSTRLTVLAYGAQEAMPGIDYLRVQVPSTFRPPSSNTLTPYTRLQVSAGGVVSNAIDLLLR